MFIKDLQNNIENKFLKLIFIMLNSEQPEDMSILSSGRIKQNYQKIQLILNGYLVL